MRVADGSAGKACRSMTDNYQENQAFPFTKRISRTIFRLPNNPALSMKNLSILSLLCVVIPGYVFGADLKKVDEFRAAAEKANAVLTIPVWEQTPETVTTAMNDAIAKANKRLDEIGAQDLKKATLKSTIVALDD